MLFRRHRDGLRRRPVCNGIERERTAADVRAFVAALDRDLVGPADSAR